VKKRHSEKKTLDPDLIEIQNNSKEWISFSHMSADRSAFPFESWMKCEHSILKLKNHVLADDPTRFPQGIYSVRSTLSRLISLTRGVNSYPEQIVLASGTQVLIEMLQYLLPKDRVYGMEDPGYMRVYQLLKKQRKPVYEIPLDDKGISFDGIRKLNPTVLYITPSHQFPTGIVMPISRRIQLLNWVVSEKGRYIIEDDYDSEFKYDCDTIPSLQGLDSADRVIYMGTFSKSMFPGLRISYMVLPQPLVRKFRHSCQFMMQTCNGFAQLTLQHFIDSGEYQKHIKRMRQIYKKRQSLLIEELNHRFGCRISIYGAHAGLHFMVMVDTQLPTDQIMKRARLNKLELYSLKRCYLNASHAYKKPAFIIGFANLPVKSIKEGVDRFYHSVF
jgi:GntR family transcriptional regulator/MocR family aminotransferase